MRVGSLFSGIGGFDAAFERAGAEIAWQVEIDDACLRVLARHWPDVLRYGDIRHAHDQRRTGCPNCLPAVDVLVGGFPCQDVSVAGLRAGLAGERSGLWFEFRRLAAQIRPRWLVIENVPGLLSSNGGRDFGVIVEGLVELGYGVAWRVLDAQYFGVAQRRRRVFVVGCLGDPGRAAQVLLEPESCGGHPPPRRHAPEDAAGSLGSQPAVAGVDQHNGLMTGAVSPTMTSGADRINRGPAVAFQERGRPGGRSVDTQTDLAYSLLSPGDGGRAHERAIAHGLSVRRLTPGECERLQGFPDGWTDGLSDSARYRCLGNAVCVPVVEWIGRRLVALDGQRALALEVG